MALTRIYFATNRAAVGDPATSFDNAPSAFDGRAVRFGTATIDPGDDTARPVLDVAAERLNPLTPDGTMRFGSKEILRALQSATDDPSREILFYIHGFRTELDGAIRTAARLSQSLGCTVFLISWPSLGETTGYLADRATVDVSGEAIGRVFSIFLRYLADRDEAEKCDRRINLLAHSMGNYALRQALQWVLRYRHLLPGGPASLPSIIDHVFLCAADEDDDALELPDKLKPLAALARDITVYHSPLDLALQVSNRVKLNPSRLGTRGPQNMRATPDNVFAVDVSPVLRGDGDLIDHGFFERSPDVADDMRRVMADGSPYKIPYRVAVPDARRYLLKRRKA